MSRTDVSAINYTDACAVLDDGTVLRFDKMFDVFGDETEEVEDAVSATAQLPDGQWIAIELCGFERVTLH